MERAFQDFEDELATTRALIGEVKTKSRLFVLNFRRCGSCFLPALILSHRKAHRVGWFEI